MHRFKISEVIKKSMIL